MRDVAALAGVALKTVSRVMNDEPTVAADLAARVHEAADKLGYRPNLMASSLRRGDGRTSTIGMLLEDVSNPFSTALLRAAEDEARVRGVQVLVASLDEDPDRERTVARALIDRSVDGLLVVPSAPDQSYLVAESRRGTKVVFIDREPRFFAADAVTSDNRAGATAAVEHLLARGHRRIAYLGDLSDLSSAAQRHQGYEQTLLRAGLRPDPHLARHGLRTTEAAARATTELLALRRPPTAIFASQNLVTIGAVKSLRLHGLQHRVALMGFDDFLLADLLEPGTSVITQDVAAIGRTAVRRLFARMDGDDTPSRVHRIETGLIERGSGEILPPSTGEPA